MGGKNDIGAKIIGLIIIVFIILIIAIVFGKFS